MKTFNRLFVVASLVITAAFAIAQDPGVQGGGAGRGGAGRGNQDATGRQGRMQGMQGNQFTIAGLVRRADVQRDIKFTDEQRSQLKAVQDEQQAEMQNMAQQMQQGGDRQAMRQAMQDMATKYDAKVVKILTEGQAKRVGEIRVQLMGIRSITVKEVQKELGFTNAQEQKVRNAEANMQQARQNMMQQMREQQIAREDMQAAMEDMNKKYLAELEKIPTEEQKGKLKTMGGEPFKADSNPEGQGRRGGRGGGGN